MEPYIKYSTGLPQKEVRVPQAMAQATKKEEVRCMCIKNRCKNNRCECLKSGKLCGPMCGCEGCSNELMKKKKRVILRPFWSTSEFEEI